MITPNEIKIIEKTIVAAQPFFIFRASSLVTGPLMATDNISANNNSNTTLSIL